MRRSAIFFLSFISSLSDVGTAKVGVGNCFSSSNTDSRLLNRLNACDPPYVHNSRSGKKAYGYEMTDAEHRRLADVLQRCKGNVAISGYRCDLMDELYEDWERIDAVEKMCHSIKKVRTEALWVNF